MIQYEKFWIADAPADLQEEVSHYVLKKGQLVKLLFVPNGLDPENELHLVHMKPMNEGGNGDKSPLRPEGMYAEITSIDRREEPAQIEGVMRNCAFTFQLKYGTPVNFTNKEIRAVLQQ